MIQIAAIILAPLLAVSVAQSAPNATDLGASNPAAPVVCHIDKVEKAHFKSLYDYANKGDTDTPKYENQGHAWLANLTVVGHGPVGLFGVALLDFVNPFAYLAAVDYYSTGLGMSWTPKNDMTGVPAGVSYQILGDSDDGMTRIRTCSLQ